MVTVRHQPEQRPALGMLAVITLLLWPLMAFGGRNPGVAISVAVLSILLAVSVSARIGGWLDLALCLAASCVLVQLVPLPPWIVDHVSPRAAGIRSSLSLVPLASTWGTLSSDRRSTAMAAVELLGVLALFFAAREQFSRGGVRRTCRAIAAMGFGLAVLAVAQAATPGRQIYWLFPTELESPLPFGPFANRNHFASWVIMAIPLSLGYLAARGVPPLRRQPGRRTSLDDLDERAIWLSAAVAAMLLALLLSLSRSGALGLVVSGVATLVLTRRARNGGHQRHLAAMLALAMVLSVSWADLPTVRDRLTGAPRELVDRVVIWTDTLPMLRDAWATGVGAGAYETGMRVYQTSDRTIYFNQAHNHYLQAAAEGGLLLLSALACAMWAFVRAAREQIKADRSSVWWIRVGAASGLAAVALQSALETGLVMSANSALAAVLAAIVVHDPRRASASAGVRSDPPASLPGHGFVILPSRSPSLPASRRG